MANYRDSFRHGTAQTIAYAPAGGAPAQSAPFGPQTYWIRVATVGAVSATLDGVRIAVGENPTANAASTLLPLNWVEIIQVTPGQKLAVIGNNAGTGSVTVTELM